MSVDDKIVSIQFDNNQFEKNMADTIKSLDNLRDSLDKAASTNAFDNLTRDSNNVDLSAIGEAVDNISSKFSALGAIGFTAIQKLTEGVMGFVAHIGQVAKTDILEPIISGGSKRAQNIEQAKFMFEGLGIDVQKGMQSALDAVLGTAFGLDEAAKAAAQFGASGIKVGAQMTSALRGVAGAAAMTGSSFSEIADIFAGSAGSGKVNNMDLMQFATRGLNAAAAIAPILHKTEAQIHEMAAAGTLDFKTFAGAMDQAFGKHATEANKTFAGSLANMHAAMSRLGASLIGPRLTQERDIFNSLSPVIDHVNKSIQPLFKAILDFQQIGANKLIHFLQTLDFKNFDLSIPNFAEAFTNAFHGVGNIITALKVGFRDIFPPSSVSLLLNISKAIKDFSDNLIVNAVTLEKIRQVFSGFFALVEIGWTILKEVFLQIKTLFDIMAPSTGGLLDMAAAGGGLAQKLNAVLVAGGGIHRFFMKMSDDISLAISMVRTFINNIEDFFGTVSKSKAADEADKNIGRIQQRFENLASIPDRVSAAWGRLEDRFSGVFEVLNKVGDYIKTWFSELGGRIAAAFQPGDFNNAVDIVNVGLLGGIALMLRKFFKTGFKEDFGLGFVKKITETLDALTDRLKAMTLNIKANALLKIAGALALLTVSVVALSLIDSVALTKALTAMAVGFGQLVGTMALLDKSVGDLKGGAKLALISGALIAIASAMDIMAVAIKILSTLNPGELATGLAGISGALGLLVGATHLLSTDSSGLVIATAAMIGMSTALLAISGVVKIFAGMSLAELAKGMGAVATSLGILVGATLLMSTNPQGLIAGTAAIIGLSGALVIISGVVKIFSSMSLGELAKGIIAMATALGVLIGATYLISTDPAGLIAASIAMNLMATAITIMSGAVLLLGQADLGTLAKGVGAIAAMLVILAVGVNAMDSAVPGALALVIVAHALSTLTDVIKGLAELSIAQIATALGALAAVLLLLAGAALLLEGALPAMLGLGIAVGAMGAGFALFGAGALLVVKALELLSKVGKAGAKAILDIVIVFLTAKIEIAKAFAELIISFAEQLLKSAPLLLRLIEALLAQLLVTIVRLTPLIADAIKEIVVEGIALIRELFPDLVTLGFDMLMAYLSGLRDNIGQIVTVGAEIIVNFIKGLTDSIPQLVAAAVDLIKTWLGELSNHVQELVSAGTDLLVNFLLGISDNLDKVIEAVGTIIANFITAVGDNSQKIIDSGADALVKFIEGVGRDIKKVVDKGAEVTLKLLEGIAKDTVEFTNKAADVLTKFLNGMAEAIRTHSKELREAGLNIASAILDGITFGLSSKAGDALGAIKDVGGGIIGAGLKALHINSPSKDFIEMGHGIIEGLVVGLGHDSNAMTSTTALANNVVGKFQETLSQIPNSLAEMDNFNPVITPVLDLTKVQTASANIDKLMRISSIVPVVSFDKARIISNATSDHSSSGDNSSPSVPMEVKFEQNNYSPSALSTNDIYRNTKSQIAMAKEELKIT